jgi:deoxyribodipyrimidine photo-lyase
MTRKGKFTKILEHPFLEILTEYKKDENVDSFFNELIVWRELARNFCYYNPNYNHYEGILIGLKKH